MNSGNSKKAIRVLSPIVFLCLSSCSLTYAYQADENGIQICYSELENNAFIGSVSLESEETEEIILPNEYNGIPITVLGGYFGRGVPTPFNVIFDSPHEEGKGFITWNDETDDSFKDATIHDLTLSLILPKNLKSIDYVEKYVHGVELTNEDGTTHAEIYRVRLCLSIDENNAYFYSEDGKLYDRKTNQLINEFIYA